MGNGPYDNRGCEAIVRGTAHILRNTFDKPRFLVCSQFHSKAHLLRQQKAETDPDIRHVRIHPLPTLKNSKFLNRVLWKMYTYLPKFRRMFMYQEILRELPEATAVLSVGGDNYSMDYGTLLNYTDLDDLVISSGKKYFIWGASVGPFSKQKKLETFMTDHLQRISGILARESKTIDYLNSIQVRTNVFLTADPSFLMEARRPEQLVMDLEGQRYIGINLNPLMAKFVCGGDLDKWMRMCVDILQALLDNFDHPILLVPHVGDTTGLEDDHLFLTRVERALSNKRVVLLPGDLDASQTKWAISRCHVFAGARTHATLASFSSRVPTLCFGYSLKAEGISHDIYGNTDLCLRSHEIDPQNVVAAMKKLLDEAESLKKILGRQIPSFEKLAYDSGALLKKLCV